MHNRVLITGASGFIGGSLAAHFHQGGFHVAGLSTEHLNDAGYPVSVIEYRIPEISRAIAEIQPAVLIHAAGSASVGDSIANPAQDFFNSVGLFQTVLEGVRQSGQRPRIVFLSSAAVYGNPDMLPVAETAPLKPISPYGYHKHMCELLAKEYSECYAMPVLVTRLFSLFGPKQKRLLVWELFQQFLSKPEVVVEGTGNESRDYLYIDDFAESLIRVLPKLNDRYVQLNIASGRSITVKEIVECIKKNLDSKKQIIYQGKVRTGNPMHWQADVSEYESLTGHGMSSNFNDKLKWTIDQWLR